MKRKKGGVSLHSYLLLSSAEIVWPALLAAWGWVNSGRRSDYCKQAREYVMIMQIIFV